MHDNGKAWGGVINLTPVSLTWRHYVLDPKGFVVWDSGTLVCSEHGSVNLCQDETPTSFGPGHKAVNEIQAWNGRPLLAVSAK